MNDQPKPGKKKWHMRGDPEDGQRSTGKPGQQQPPPPKQPGPYRSASPTEEKKPPPAQPAGKPDDRPQAKQPGQQQPPPPKQPGPYRSASPTEEKKPGASDNRPAGKQPAAASKPKPTVRLLAAIGDRFEKEANRCETQAGHLRSRANAAALSLEKAVPAYTPANSIFALLEAALMMVVLAVGIFTPLHELLDLERWGFTPKHTEVVLVVTAVIVGVWLALVLRPKDMQAALNIKIMAPTFGAVIVIAYWFFVNTDKGIKNGIRFRENSNDDIEALLWQTGILAVAILLLLAALVLGGETARSRPSERRVALRVTAWWMAGAAIFAINYDAHWNDRPRMQPFLAMTGIAAVMFLSTAVGLVFLLHQAIRKIRAWEKDASRDVYEAEQWAAKALTCRAARLKWVPTAAVLDYLIRSEHLRPELVTDAGIGRIDECPIQRMRFLSSQSAPSRPPRGWLIQRYRKAAEVYMAETGSDPMLITETVQPLSDFPAWQNNRVDPQQDFAHRLRVGEYDDILTERNAAASVLDAAATAVLADVRPPPDAAMPVGFLEDLAQARIAPLGVERYQWSRPDIAGIDEGVPHDRCDPVDTAPETAGNVTVYQAVRVDVSKPVKLSDLGWAEQPDGEEDHQPTFSEQTDIDTPQGIY